MPGLFITLEGGEGAGKSTQAKRLELHLKQFVSEVVVTREPGGTGDGERIRELLVTGEAGRWSAEAEAMLNYAARDTHLREVIRPALQRGAAIICDRFMDSTRAYQAYAGNCPQSFIDVLERTIVGTTRPNLTLVFDLSVEEGLRRARERGVEGRHEGMGREFHEKLRRGFLDMAAQEPERFVVLDAGKPVDLVFGQIVSALKARSLV